MDAVEKRRRRYEHLAVRLWTFLSEEMDYRAREHFASYKIGALGALRGLKDGEYVNIYAHHWCPLCVVYIEYGEYVEKRNCPGCPLASGRLGRGAPCERRGQPFYVWKKTPTRVNARRVLDAIREGIKKRRSRS